MRNQELKVFKNPVFGNVRVINKDGEPWFIGRDVAIALGYTKPENAIARHCKGQTTTPKQGGGFLGIIPERDVYRLIMRSKLPSAERFEEWVVGDVLPSIRKHGAYMTPGALEQAIGDPDFAIGLLTSLKEERAKRECLQRQNDQMRPKVESFKVLVASSGNYTLREAAKALDQGPNKFTALLRDNRVLYRLNGQNIPNQKYINRGYFDVKVKTNERVGKSFSQTFVTPKGLSWLRERFVHTEKKLLTA